MMYHWFVGSIYTCPLIAFVSMMLDKACGIATLG